MATGSVSAQGCCNPLIVESDPTGAVIGSEFTDIMVNMKPCCTVELTTSAGKITLKPPMVLYSKEFKCALTLESVAVTGCDTSDVWITLIKE